MAEVDNSDQIAYWNESSGPKWVMAQEVVDALVSPAGKLALERADVRAGERALDVGCGCGQTTLALGEAVGPQGHVLGIDVSRPMLERARERAAEAGMEQVELREADAQSATFDQRFDLLFSRFGVMFFADPSAAFANLRKAMAPGGRLAFVCWQALERNEWMSVPLRAFAEHLPLPPPGDPNAPGPFAFADPDRVRQVLGDAGWSNVGLEGHVVELAIAPGSSLETAVGFILNIGPTARALQDVAPDVRERVAESIARAVEPFMTPTGVVMKGNVWVVSARNQSREERAA